MKRRVVSVYNLQAYPVSALPLWKRILLPLVKVRVEEAEGVTLHYKMLLGSMYILKVVRKQKSCGCVYHRGAWN